MTLLVVRRGMPRVNAKAKDSEWIRQRQALEAAKPADVNEVILVSQDGALTEGLTSNFFVLSERGDVITAQEGVLDGTVRQVILQVVTTAANFVRMMCSSSLLVLGTPLCTL